MSCYPFGLRLKQKNPAQAGFFFRNKLTILCNARLFIQTTVCVALKHLLFLLWFLKRLRFQSY